MVLGDVWLVARIPHRCSICGGVIASGDRYRRQRGVYDGEPGTWKAHALCEAAYFEAHRTLGLFEDEGPDWWEDVAPLVTAAICALAGVEVDMAVWA